MRALQQRQTSVDALEAKADAIAYLRLLPQNATLGLAYPATAESASDLRRMRKSGDALSFSPGVWSARTRVEITQADKVTSMEARLCAQEAEIRALRHTLEVMQAREQQRGDPSSKR